MTKHFSILAVFIFLLAQAGMALAVGNKLEIRVFPEVEVYGETYTLGEIAEMDGFNLEVISQLAKVRIGASPLPGRTVIITMSTIRARIASVINPRQVKIIVPSDAKVLRAGQVITGREIAQKVEAYALKNANEEKGGSREITQKVLTTLPDIRLPKGELSWNILPLGKHLRAGGRRTYKVTAIVLGKEAWRGMVHLRQKIYERVVVALRPIRKGRVVSDRDVTLEKREISQNRGNPFIHSLESVVGMKARRHIAKQEPLNSQSVGKPMDLSEGGKVTLIYRSGTLVMKTMGVALVSGHSGDFIPVRNLSSGKVIYGILKNNETVEVN